MRYKITLEIESDKKRELIEPYIRYTLKMVKINKVKVEDNFIQLK
jgi:hypothetical protein